MLCYSAITNRFHFLFTFYKNKISGFYEYEYVISLIFKLIFKLYDFIIRIKTFFCNINVSIADSTSEHHRKKMIIHIFTKSSPYKISYYLYKRSLDMLSGIYKSYTFSLTYLCILLVEARFRRLIHIFHVKFLFRIL